MFHPLCFYIWRKITPESILNTNKCRVFIHKKISSIVLHYTIKYNHSIYFPLYNTYPLKTWTLQSRSQQLLALKGKWPMKTICDWNSLPNEMTEAKSCKSFSYRIFFTSQQKAPAWYTTHRKWKGIIWHLQGYNYLCLK